MKESVAVYLLALADKDAAFAKKLNLRKLNSCIEYVTKKAKKYLSGRNGCIEDTLIYKWAVEYYMNGNTGMAVSEAPEAPEHRKIKSWAEAKAELEAKKRKIKKEREEPVSDVEQGQLLFDFMEQEEYKEWTSKML